MTDLDHQMNPDEEDAYLAWLDGQAAIREGRATDLARCYLCHLETWGVADTTRDSIASPLRGIIAEVTTPGPDPYAALKLTCGHTII